MSCDTFAIDREDDLPDCTLLSSTAVVDDGILQQDLWGGVLECLLERIARKELLSWAIGGWATQVVAAQQRRSNAFFDAMGGQLRSAQRRCSLMEVRAMLLEPLRSTISAWRSAIQVERARRSRARFAEVLAERVESDVAVLTVWRVLAAWRSLALDACKENLQHETKRSAATPECDVAPKGLAEMPLFILDAERTRARSAENGRRRCQERRILMERPVQDSARSCSVLQPVRDADDCGRAALPHGPQPCSVPSSVFHTPTPARLRSQHRLSGCGGSASSPRIAVMVSGDRAEGSPSVAGSSPGRCRERFPMRPASTGRLSPAVVRARGSGTLAAAVAAATAAAAAAVAVAGALRPAVAPEAGGTAAGSTGPSAGGASASSTACDVPASASVLPSTPQRQLVVERGIDAVTVALAPSVAPLSAAEPCSPPCWRDIEPPGQESSPAPQAALPRGPERLFYDTARYTGCARFGGPTISDRPLGPACTERLAAVPRPRALFVEQNRLSGGAFVDRRRQSPIVAAVRAG